MEKLNWDLVLYNKINGDAPEKIEEFHGTLAQAKIYCKKEYKKELDSGTYYITINCYNMI